METKKVRYETDKAVAIIEYTKLPGKAELEESCARFMRNVMREREKREEEKRRNEQGERKAI